VVRTQPWLILASGLLVCRIWMWRLWRPPTTWSARPRIAICAVC
jgi:hypothetical protein